MRPWEVSLGALAVCLALLSCALTANRGGAVGEPKLRFMPNLRVTDQSSPYAFQVEPSLTFDSQGRLFVGWKEALTATGGGERVGFARSINQGLTWSANILMNRIDGRFRQSDPWLTVDELGRLYFARLEYSLNLSQNGVVVSRSDDGGVSWGPMVNVHDRPGFADKESIVSDGAGSLYIAYDDVGRYNTSIRFTRSLNGGASWSPTVGVNDRPSSVLGPVLAAAPGGRVYVVWSDLGTGNIMADASADGGVTWGTDVQVNRLVGSTRPNPLLPWKISLPSMTIDRNGSLYVAWPDRANGDLDIVVARSNDGGRSWSTPVRVNDDDSRTDQWMPALAIDGIGVLHVAWMDERTGNLNVFYSRSRDGGRTWSTNIRVTTEETPIRYVRPGDYFGLAADRNGTVYMAWTDGRGADLDIYFAKAQPTRPDDAPWAAFTLAPIVGNLTTTFTANASGSWDLEDPVGSLQVRWDWENDGHWTNWSTTKIAYHRFSSTGPRTIRLEVMDRAGLTDQTTQVARVQANTSGPGFSIAIPLWASASALGATSAGVLGLLVWEDRQRRRPRPPTP